MIAPLRRRHRLLVGSLTILVAPLAALAIATRTPPPPIESAETTATTLLLEPASSATPPRLSLPSDGVSGDRLPIDSLGHRRLVAVLTMPDGDRR